MRRTGYESAMWHLVRQIRFDRLAAPALIGLWFAGWLALLMTLLTPID